MSPLSYPFSRSLYWKVRTRTPIQKHVDLFLCSARPTYTISNQVHKILLCSRFLQVWKMKLKVFVMDCVSFFKFSLMKNDLRCWFLLYGCFKQLFNAFGVFMLFHIGLKFLKFSCHFWGEPKNPKLGFDEKCNSKLSYCKCESFKLLRNSSPPMIDELEECKQNVVNSNCDVNEDSDIDDEHQVFDVMTLRKLVKKERAKANAANLELEKERMAATTAAEEAMAMILRLQNEKSLIEMEANHYRRLAEEKQQHDREVIQSLQWIVMKHESERSVLEEKLRLCRQKLKVYMKNIDDEGGHYEGFDEFWGFSDAKFEDDLYH